MLSSILALPLLAAAAVASPGWGPWGHGGHGGPGQQCLNASQVNTIISEYSYLLINPTGANFNSIANSLLSDSFFVASDSIDSLAGKPVSHYDPTILASSH